MSESDRPLRSPECPAGGAEAHPPAEAGSSAALRSPYGRSTSVGRSCDSYGVAAAAGLVLVAGLLLGFFWWGYWLGDYNLFRYQDEYQWEAPGDLFGELGLVRMVFELKLWLYLSSAVGFLAFDWLLVSALRARRAGESIGKALVADARAFVPFLGMVYFAVVVATAREPGLPSLFIFILALAWHAALQCQAVTVVGLQAPPIPGPARQGTTRSSRWGMVVVVALSLLVFAAFAWMNVRGYQSLRVGYKDSGMFATILHNTLHGRPFFADTIAVASKHYLGRHFSPGLLFLLPVFALFPRHETLLVLHALFLVAAAVPIYLASRRLSGSTVVGASLACGYLVAAPLSHTNWGNTYGFQPYSMVVLVVAWTLWAAVAGCWGWFALCVALGLLVEEQYALTLMGLGALLLVRPWGEAKPGARRLGAALVVLGAVWFACAVFWWMPWFGGGKVAGRYYGYLGGTPLQMVAALPGAVLRALADWNRWEFLVHLLLPVGFLALAAPGLLLVGAPLLLVIILADNPSKYSIILGHQGALLPVIALAGAAGARRVAECSWSGRLFSLRRRVPGPRALAAALAVLVITASLGSGRFFAVSPMSRVYPEKTFEVSQRDLLVKRIQDLVPPDASVCATFRVASHFAVREHLFLYPLDFDPADYPSNLGDPDYVLLDFAENWTHPGAVLAGRDALWSDPARRLLYAEEGFLLYGRGENDSPELLRQLTPSPARPRQVLDRECGYGVVLVGIDSRVDPAEPRKLPVTYYWKLTRRLDRDLFAAVRVEQGEEPPQMFYHLLVNGVVPAGELPVGRTFTQTNVLELAEDASRVPARPRMLGLLPVPAAGKLADAVKAGLSAPGSSPLPPPPTMPEERGW